MSLLPDNPYYFSFRGRPTALITSGGHCGSVLNLDFDHRTYLDAPQREGFSHTRLFAGVYRERPR